MTAYLLERTLDTIEQTEPQDEDFLFTFGEGTQDEVDLFAH